MAMTTEVASKLDVYRDLARQLRADIIRCSSEAGSGHPTSSLSAADLMAVLMTGHLRYSFDDPDNPASDHLVFSKGHASPLLYAMFRAAGAIDDAELMSYRKFGSRLEGHPTPVLPWVDVATGSLGQGLPIGVGIGLAGKFLEAPYHVWVLVGDSETAEGSIWEAFARGSHERLGNLTAIVDVNRLGQAGPTELQWDIDAYARRIEGFGWLTIKIDGHNLEEIDDAYRKALENDGRPTAIIAKTIKGKGVSFAEDQLGLHGKALDDEKTAKALSEIGDEPSRTFEIQAPPSWDPPKLQRREVKLPTYSDTVATRKAYGDTLVALGDARDDVVVLDGEVSNSTHSEEFKKTHEDRFFEMFIAEQQMVGAAVGMQVAGLVPFASTFAAFLTRAYDFIRMGAVSRADIRLSGSHAGVSIGEDGPSQMALEDLSMMRAVHGSTVLYPCDANQTASLVAQMAERDGVCYIRTTREKTPVIYGPDDTFTIGGSRLVRESNDDRVTVIAAGITVHEAIKAADELAESGVNVRLMDAYTVKPIDVKALTEAARATEGRIVVAEDHWAEGGLGEAVLSALAEAGVGEIHFAHLAVRDMPTSGKPAELLDDAGISAKHIVKAVNELLP